MGKTVHFKRSAMKFEDFAARVRAPAPSPGWSAPSLLAHDGRRHRDLRRQLDRLDRAL